MDKSTLTIIPITGYNYGMTCSIPACSRVIHAKQLCEMHYRRLLRKGNVGGVVALRTQEHLRARPEAERFHASIKKMANGCWEWQAALTTAGYAEFQSGGRTVYVHRWVYETYKGKIPNGYDIDHRCHNLDKTCNSVNLCRHRRCLNPEHLDTVPRRVNALRGRRKNNVYR